MKITLRHALETDIEWILGQLKNFSESVETKLSLFGSATSSHGFMLALVKDHYVLIAEGENVGPVGFIAGILAPHPYNPGLIALSESFWWVQEDARGSRAGLMLLNAFTEYGKEVADWTIMTLEHNSPVNVKSLTKRGFRQLETSYLLENL